VIIQSHLIAVTSGKTNYKLCCENCVWYAPPDKITENVGRCTKSLPRKSYGEDLPFMGRQQWCGGFELKTGEKYIAVRSDYYKPTASKVINAKGTTKRQSSRRKEVGSV